MSDTALIFNILAIDRASAKIHGIKGAFGMLAVGAAAAGAEFAAKSVQMAADFERSQLMLVTTAGEAQSNLKMVSDGVLDMSGKVGVSALELSHALYTVESAGYHGADGLKVLEAAAKGAKIEGADTKEVADAVSSALNDYHLSADHAAEVTNTLIAAVGHGKTTMGELAQALPNVMSAGHSAGVSLQEMAAALATMTMHGTSASTAGTYLRQVILGLENPSVKARGVMQSLGLDANKVSQNLGKNGLASTIGMVEGAIKNHLSPAGLVAVEAFKKSSGSTTDFQKALANLPSGQKTAIGALADMVGGVKNLQGFLQLGGDNLATFKANTKAVGDQVKSGGKDIDGWSKYQQTFNAKMADAKESLNAVKIKIGNELLPVAKDLLDNTISAVTWFSKHKTVTQDLGIAVGVLAGFLLSYKVGLMAVDTWHKIVTVSTGIWEGAQWLLNAAMDANPVGLLIVGIGLLIAGIVLLWQHSETFRRIVTTGWDYIKIAILTAVVFILHYYGMMLGGAAAAFGWIPGIGGKLKAASKKFEDFATSVNKELQGIKDKTVTITVARSEAMFGKPGTTVGGVGGKAYKGLAAGGPFKAGDVTWVGETGPELVAWGASGTVIPAHTSSQIAARAHTGGGNGGGGGTTVIELRSSGARVDDLLLEILRNAIRVRGGNVQTVMGR